MVHIGATIEYKGQRYTVWNYSDYLRIVDVYDDNHKRTFRYRDITVICDAE